MHSSFTLRLNSLAEWRATVDRAAVALARWLQEHDLHGDAESALLKSLRERLVSEKLHVAFVAEFSRGKSELINAIFFADTGRRVLPATPGRTTMCPVELSYDEALAPSLALLPIETRLRGLTLADLRGRDEPWTRLPLDPSDADALARSLAEVTRTRRVSVDEARALGLWDDEQADDNPPLLDDGTVEVPAWRHALINYPHPMLRQGLVVLDTPGLNAIGAEPELTLNLLPSAHAVVFVLAADTGVTRSDLAVWRDHLGARALERFVVLNKIDALADPLATPAVVERQIAQQRDETARTLGIPPARVFPLSARDGLAGRVDRNIEKLVRSRLPDLESALSNDLLPRQQELLAAAVRETLSTLRLSASRRLGDQRRQNAEETLELRGLRGKSGAKVRQMLERVQAETADFERCIARLQALRAVQQKLLKQALAPMSSDQLRREVTAMQTPNGLRILPGAAARSFALLGQRMHEALMRSSAQAVEMQQMIEGSFAQLNAEYGFSFALAPLPDLARFDRELGHIEHRYGKFLGLSSAWRMSAPGASEQFRRMLLSKLRVVFETATGELEIWSKAAEAQVEIQLRERRRSFKRRHEALQRIQSAAGELEARISELEQQEQRLRELQSRLDNLIEATETATRPNMDISAQRNAA
jgi:Dynamin family